jgi:hypothetical protein
VAVIGAMQAREARRILQPRGGHCEESAVGRPGQCRRVGHGLEGTRLLAVKDRANDLVFASREVIVQRAGHDAELARQVCQSQAAGAVFEQQHERRVQHFLSLQQVSRGSLAEHGRLRGQGDVSRGTHAALCNDLTIE